VHAPPDGSVPNVGASRFGVTAPTAGRACPAPTKSSHRHHSGPVRIRDRIYKTVYLVLIYELVNRMSCPGATLQL
jgi:hypothetical protein